MGIAVMWKYLALALVATATVAALPVTEEHLLDDNTNLIATEDSQVANLQKKLAKLEHTFARIKSCVANNVPHELGEAMNESKVVPKTVQQLKAAITAKNAAIDKIADACMPGEEES